MTPLLAAAGATLVLIALVDVVWTTVAAGSGAGPVTGRLASGLWRTALTVHRRRPSHSLLSAAGVGIVLAVLLSWICLVSGGWLLVLASSDGAVLSSTTGEPAGLVDRMWFTGYSVFTLGNGDFVPGDGAWQVLTVALTGTGLALVTLSITYLVPVASAVAQRRQLASYVSSLGHSAEEIVTRAWTGSGFGSLAQHLVTMAPLVHGVRQRHLTYPVLHYFHSRDPESALAPSLAKLSSALDLLRCGVDPGVRPDPAAVGVLGASIDSFLETLGGARITPAAVAVPPPDPARLTGAGVPTVDRATFERAAGATCERRRLLAAYLRDDGWDVPAR